MTGMRDRTDSALPGDEPGEQSARARSDRSADQPLKKWQGLVDEQIAEAFRRGAFDNLPGAGKPLVLDDNPFAGDKRLAYHLLKANNFAPPEIELDKEIRADLARADALAERLRQRGERLASRAGSLSASEKRSFAAMVERTMREYRALLTEINRKILSLNLTTPALMHRRSVDVEQRVADLRRNMPRLT